MKQNKIDEALQEVKLLIDLLNSRIQDAENRVLFFEHQGLGSLHLNYEEYLRYSRCLENLVKSSVKDEDLSIKSVESTFQEALLTAFYFSKILTIDNNLTQEEILNDLKQKLTAKRIPYCCYIPVCGIQEEGLPLHIGGIEFVIFDDIIVSNLHERIAKHSVHREFKREMIESDIDRSFYKQTCGVVTIEAKDYEAAKVMAIKKLRGVLDTINFLSTLVPYNPKAWTYLKGDLEPCFFETIILNEDDGSSYNSGGERIGPLLKLNIQLITQSIENEKNGFDYILTLLQENKLNKFEQALLTAIQWAGRAVVANRREEAFLLYAIALESIVLVDNPGNELSYRLRVRIAHLLTNTLTDRNEVVNTVRELYNLRSKLVHDGKYEITDLDLQSIESICIGCITRLCIDPLFQKMTSPKDFSDWLEDQILR